MTKRGPTDVCQNDWRFYLVKRWLTLSLTLERLINHDLSYSFEDRDMLMRYLQQGIGHMFTGSAPKNNNADYVVDESEAYITEDTEDTSSEKDQNNDPGTRKLTWTLEEEEPDFEGNSDSESTKSEYLSCQAAWVLDKIWSRKLTLSKDYIPI